MGRLTVNRDFNSYPKLPEGMICFPEFLGKSAKITDQKSADTEPETLDGPLKVLQMLLGENQKLLATLKKEWLQKPGMDIMDAIR